jgi:hypothetical protein
VSVLAHLKERVAHTGPDAAWVSECPSSGSEITLSVHRLHRDGRETLILVDGLDEVLRLTAGEAGVLTRLLQHALGNIGLYSSEAALDPADADSELRSALVEEAE